MYSNPDDSVIMVRNNKNDNNYEQDNAVLESIEHDCAQSDPPILYSTKMTKRRKSKGAVVPEHLAPPQAKTALPKSTLKKKKQGFSSERNVNRIIAGKALVQDAKESIEQVVKKMVESRQYATLLTDEKGILCGILTDKDVAYKVIGEDLDPKKVAVAEIMTRDLSCVSPSASTMQAMKTMVNGQFRHLPVAEEGKVVGLLDITKCLYDVIAKIEKAYEVSNKRFTKAVSQLERELCRSDSATSLFETMREKLFMPTLSTLVKEHKQVPKVLCKDNVQFAAKLMKREDCSAVVVYESFEDRYPAGILTTKDVLACALGQQASCAMVKDFMTQNPDVATLETSIVDALHLMHNGHFLHLPILNTDGLVVGLTDVLQVTYGVISQMGSVQQVADVKDNNTWNTFFDSTFSESNEHQDNQSPWVSSLSAASGEYLEPILLETAFTNTSSEADEFKYKIKDTNGEQFYFKSSASSLEV